MYCFSVLREFRELHRLRGERVRLTGKREGETTAGLAGLLRLLVFVFSLTVLGIGILFVPLSSLNLFAFYLYFIAFLPIKTSTHRYPCKKALKSRESRLFNLKRLEILDLYKMVLLHVKRDQRSLFLFETQLKAEVGSTLETLVEINNGRLKVKRLGEEMRALAEHGTATPPEMRGLLEEQVRELGIRDEEGERCEPSGGSEFRRDELQKRCGRAPREEMRQVLLKAAGEVEKMVSEENVKADKTVDRAVVKEALDIARGAVAIVYPMGLPTFDPVRMELENAEELAPDSQQARGRGGPGRGRALVRQQGAAEGEAALRVPGQEREDQGGGEAVDGAGGAADGRDLAGRGDAKAAGHGEL